MGRRIKPRKMSGYGGETWGHIGETVFPLLVGLSNLSAHKFLFSLGIIGIWYILL
jgi:hypothetical protein